ncbi:MAG: sulfatase-like hydrolase/transferase [Breznakibacter sp.]
MKKQCGIVVNEYLWMALTFTVMLILYAVCRLLFYWFNQDLFPGVSMHALLTMMKGGVLFDVSALLYLNGLFYLFAILPLPFKFSNGYQSFLRWLFVSVNAIGLALNAIDFKYYPFILRRTTRNVADILQNETNLWKLFGQFTIDYWYVFLLWAAMVYTLVLFTKYVNPKPIPFSKRWFTYPVAISALAIFAGFSVVGIRGGYGRTTRPITLSNAGVYVQSPEQTAIVLNTPFSVIRTWGNKSFEKMTFFDEETKLAEIFNPVVTVNDSLPMNKKNVVIILWESCTREHSGFLNPTLDNGTYKGYTPFLDSLMQHSLVFPNAFANGRKSIDALPSVMASLPALVMPYVVSEYSSNKVNSLASLLDGQGYRTSFFHGAPNGSMGFSSFTNLAGFQKYYGKNEFNNDKFYDGMWGIWDEEFLGFFADEISKMPQPFFTSVFTVSSHHPFQIPERYKGVFPEGKTPLHKCIGYTDNALRLFFQKASKQPWFNQTLFVITADHSTSPVHEEYKNNMNAFAIPLFFYTPDGSLKGINERLAQQIDIMPTVLSYLNYPDPFIAFGNNLLNEHSKSFVANYVGGSYQFIMDDKTVYFDGKKITEAFNYKQDPALQHDISKAVDTDSIASVLKAFLQQYNNRMLENNLVVNKAIP